MNIKNELLKVMKEDMPKNLTPEQKRKSENIIKEISKDDSKPRIC